jgi:Ni,Fe-hydrogenase III large subunit
LKGAVANFTSGAALQATEAAEKVAREGDLPGANQAYRKLTAELDRLKSGLTEFSHRQRGLKAKGQSAN